MDEFKAWQAAITEIWNNQAVDWHERSQHMWDAGSRKDIIPFIEKHLQEAAYLLDIGCGSGYSSNKLSAKGYEVTGVDISEKMIELARKSQKTAPYITFERADVNNLPFVNDVFDAMMAINVLEWTNNPSHALKEMTRTLKTEGLLCVGILGPTAGPRVHSYDRVYGKSILQNTMMPWELLRLAKELGYELVDDMPVWKRHTDDIEQEKLPKQLQQAISFMWVFMLRKK